MELLNNGRPFKSSKSGAAGHCVQVQHLDAETVTVSHSTNPDAGTIQYTSAEWTAFIAGAKAGEFDLPTV